MKIFEVHTSDELLGSFKKADDAVDFINNNGYEVIKTYLEDMNTKLIFLVQLQKKYN